MSLTVEHLNADTTFLLTFAPGFAPAHASARFPGSFTVLLDPWLSGPSSMWKPSFQISHHTTTPSVSSLKDIPEPDLIIVSQDKPDHCHKETLCTLPANSKVRILATPAAAKKIRSWNYFTHANIQSLQPYKAEKDDTMVRIRIPGYTSLSGGGEVTVSYLPAKMDMTKLHNAIAITYREPSSSTRSVSGSVVNLFNLPPSPPPSPVGGYLRHGAPNHSLLPTPPDSPMERQMGLSPPVLAREKTLSVLYSPHGVSYSAISSYASSHLKKEAALPLTTMFHSINTEENPWFMGGVVAAGYPGGLEIVRQLGAQCWISAHDELKDNRGWSVAFIKSTRYTMEEVQQKLEEDMAKSTPAEKTQRYGDKHKTQVMNLEPGEQIRIADGYVQ